MSDRELIAADKADIVWRLRANWSYLGREAADEITRLRLAINRLRDQDATLSVQGGNVTVTMDGTLTDAEREAVEVILSGCSEAQEYSVASNAVKIVRGLLERTK